MKIAFPVIFGEIDTLFIDQMNAAKKAGFEVATVNENFNFNCSNETILYKGWILKPCEYTLMQENASKRNNTLIFSQEQYLRGNYISNWYNVLSKYTMKTEIIENPYEEKFADFINNSDWKGFFLKDYVKSLKSTKGSLVRNVSEARSTIYDMEITRGEIEGGLVIRKETNLENEIRYFSYNGTVLSMNEYVPSIVTDIIKSFEAAYPADHFISIDIATNTDTGNLILVEIGDGQVSDPVDWDYDTFYEQLFILRNN